MGWHKYTESPTHSILIWYNVPKKEVLTMKKIIVSFIAGALLMAAGQVFADDISLVGKKVGGEAKVILNGKEISDAVIIDSKSYAPVRDISESFGANVEYEQGVITIDSITEEKSNDEIANINAEIKGLEGQKFNAERKISDLDNQISSLLGAIQFINDKESLRETESQKEAAKNSIAELEEKITPLKSEQDQLLQQIEDLNKEIAALESTL